MEQEIKSLSQRVASDKFFMFTFTLWSTVSQQIIFILIMHEKEKKRFVTKDFLFKFECTGNNKTTLNSHMNNQFWLIKQCDKTKY